MKLFFKYKLIVENYRNPVIPIDEIDQMLMSIPENVSKELTIPKDVLNSFELQDELNPKLWDGFSLKPSIRVRLVKIANDFFKELNLPPNVTLKDILFTGSLANFNWSKFSDVDLHLVLDFSKLEASEEMKEAFFHLQKSQWNDKHDIKLFGYPVEIYAQDISHKLTATAIYSVKRNKWVLKPQRETFKLSKKNLKAKVDYFISHLQDIKEDYANKDYHSAISKAEALKDKIKKYRLSGLDKGGEFSLENLVFKVLRRTPFMDVLSDLKANAYDKQMSLNETQGILTEEIYPFEEDSASTPTSIDYEFPVEDLTYYVYLMSKQKGIYNVSFTIDDYGPTHRINKGVVQMNNVLATVDAIIHDAVSKYPIEVISFFGLRNKEESRDKNSIRTEFYLRYIKQKYPDAKITQNSTGEVFIDVSSIS